MFRFLSTQVERLRESLSPSKTNPKTKKNKKTKTNKGKSTTTHKTKKVKRETKTKTTTKRSTKQTKLGVKGGVAKNNKKKNGVAAKSKPQSAKTGKQDTASTSKKTCTNNPKTDLDLLALERPSLGQDLDDYLNQPYIRPLARPWEEIAFKVGCHLAAQGFDAERGVAMVRRDLAGDRGAARQHLVLSSYQTFNLSMQTKAKGKRRPDARGFLVQLFGAAGEKGLRVE